MWKNRMNQGFRSMNPKEYGLWRQVYHHQLIFQGGLSVSLSLQSSPQWSTARAQALQGRQYEEMALKGW